MKIFYRSQHAYMRNEDFLHVITRIRENKGFTDFLTVITHARKNLTKPHFLPYNKLESLTGKIIVVKLQS